MGVVVKWEEEQTSVRKFSYFLLWGQEKARVIYKNHSCQTGIFSLAPKKVNTALTPKIATFGAESFTLYRSVKSLLLTMRKKKERIHTPTHSPKNLVLPNQKTALLEEEYNIYLIGSSYI